MNPDAGIMSWEQADQIMQDQRAEIERLREAIRRLADQDATLSVCDGNVTVEMDATLTDAEREALRRMLPTIMYEPHRVAVESILERLG
jgi:hypothetical protein